MGIGDEFVQRPAFLDRHSLETTPVGEGSFVEVHGAQIPAKIKSGVNKKEPTDLVVKRYKNEHGDDDVFIFEREGLSQAEKRKFLRDRFRSVRDYFKDALPDLTIKTSVTVADDVSGGSEIYEIQPRIFEWYDPFRAVHDENSPLNYRSKTQEFLNSVKDEDGDFQRSVTLSMEGILDQTSDTKRLENIVREMRLFEKKAGKISSSSDRNLEGRFLDLLGRDNLVVVADGLRLLDTNVLFEESIIENKDKLNIYKAQMKFLRHLANALEKKLN